MTYITVKLPPIYQQMSLEEFLFGLETKPRVINSNYTNTRTYVVDTVPQKLLETLRVDKLITLLMKFNESTQELREKDTKTLYHTFHLPKKSGGVRRIDAPLPELMDALRHLKTIFEEGFGVLYHTSAFAYIKNRCAVDAIKRHQANESKWFGKYDLSDFFGSTTLDFVMRMFSMVYPFSEVVKFDDGREELRKALSLAFLNGGLPQGTPISPLITTVMMIPIDHKLSNSLRDFNGQRYIYTRYADDFTISSRYSFSFEEIEKHIVDCLKSFEAPFTIKSSKTRYGSSAGSNWNLGVMLNKDNQITVGYKKKRQFKAMLTSYVMDKLSGVTWEKYDVQVMDGLRNYYHSVEGEVIDRLIEHIGMKFNVDIIGLIKEDLRA